VAAGILFDEQMMSSSSKLDAEGLEVAGLGGYALGAAGDDESGDRQVGVVWWVGGAFVNLHVRLYVGLPFRFRVASGTLL
jgi:hypothetical protein